MRTATHFKGIRCRSLVRSSFDMEDLIARIWENIADRVSGPMWFRLILQPLMASLFALRDALADARDGRPGYFWAVMTHKGARRDLIREGWSSVAKVFVMATIIDIIYQWIVQRWIYPVETLVVAFLLAVVPYILIRGPVNRIVGRFNTAKARFQKPTDADAGTASGSPEPPSENGE